ncbi:zinc ribbon domain-containing protein [Butyrivibrio fibrisolvens]|uniref:zinc ribbon domain-containing protein n=1 Tax=Butyrivibrio fibrisolvens TaxID=831 RepID=UPI0020C0B52A|nr:zinc ribbon domain-containing protein [Butyrivibrio fibrisolvens]
MYCSKCGKQLNDDDAFCSGCGQPTGINTGQAPSQSQSISTSSYMNQTSSDNSYTDQTSSIPPYNQQEPVTKEDNTLAIIAIVISFSFRQSVLFLRW